MLICASGNTYWKFNAGQIHKQKTESPSVWLAAQKLTARQAPHVAFVELDLGMTELWYRVLIWYRRHLGRQSARVWNAPQWPHSDVRRAREIPILL
jgi:hypothetical protein